MQPQDALTTIAEIAITLAGFTAILLTVQSSLAGGQAPGQSDHVIAVLVIPAIVFLCALLPFGLAGLSSSPAVVWGIPLCAYALLSGVLLTRTVIRIRVGSVQFTWPKLAYCIVAVAAFVHLAALASGLGLVVPFSPGILVLGLVWSLLAAAYSLIAAVRAAVVPPVT